MSVFAALILILMTSAPVLAEAVIVYFHERPPYFIKKENQVTGITGQEVTNLFERAGVAFQWIEKPAKRQILNIKNNDNTFCAAGWFKNAEREQFAQFVGPIYTDLPMSIMVNPDYVNAISGKSIYQIMQGKEGVVLLKDGYSYGAFIDTLLEQSTLDKLITSSDDLTMARMVALRRADFMFLSEEEGQYMLKQEGLDKFRLGLARPKDMPPGNARYLMCSQKVPEAILQSLRTALDPKLMLVKE